jgi:hypothetical protein
MSKKQLLAVLLSAFTISVSAQSYAEGTDLPGTGTGPNFIMMGPAMTISGTLNTPADGQDRFQITIPAGCQITGASWTMTDTANIGVTGFAQFGWNNQENIPPLNGTFANGPFAPFPVPPGMHDCMMNANIAANDHWSMTFYSDCPLGMANVNFTEPVSVYPNPTSDILFLSGVAAQSEFVLTNSLGQIVLTQTLSGTAIQPIDLGGLAEGVYYYTTVSEVTERSGRVAIIR